VPDVHHILAKGGGVFCNPALTAAPAKLRLVYEAAPLAFILEVSAINFFPDHTIIGTMGLRFSECFEYRECRWHRCLTGFSP
jgi:hypothetical protein